MSIPLLFDAVLFDLDGTLVATDRFWIDCADRGTRRAYSRLGIRRELPTPSQWMSLVGVPLEVGFRSIFPELEESARREVQQACLDEEQRTLQKCGVPGMPDACETLRLLSERGVRIGIASNCERSYLDQVLDGLGLRPYVDGALCRESPGMLCKGDMVASLLASFGTRSALMVGDRSSDRDAAWENGIPHVHCSFGYAQGDESVEAEGRIRSLDELPELLARRAAWVNAALERVGAFSRPGLRIGITGGPAAGKTTFARDAARVLRARGLRASALSMQPFVAPSAADPADPLEQACDTERLLAEVLKPHEHGREILLEAPDLLGQRRIERGATVFLAGPALLGAKLRLGLDRLILIDVDEPVQKRRLSGRARARGAGEPDSVPPADCQLELERRYPPEQNADLVLDGSNPLGEELGRVEACARNAAFATLRDPAGSS